MGGFSGSFLPIKLGKYWKFDVFRAHWLRLWPNISPLFSSKGVVRFGLKFFVKFSVCYVFQGLGVRIGNFLNLKNGKGWGHKRGDLKMPFSTWKTPENPLKIPLKTPTSLNKEVRLFSLSDNSTWSFPSVSSPSDYSIWRSWRLF